MGRQDFESKVVGIMIDIYKKGHSDEKDELEVLKAYAVSKVDDCVFGEEKPVCKNCKAHCYKPEMREKIRMVMRYSGPRLVLYHPVMAIKHLYHMKKG